jgi:hypothetical protein
MAEPMGMEILVGVVFVGVVGYWWYQNTGAQNPQQPERRQQPQQPGPRQQQQAQPNQQLQQSSETTFQERKLEHFIYLAGMIGGGIVILLALPDYPAGAGLGALALVFSAYRFQTRPL